MRLRNTYTNLHPGIKLMIVFTLVFIGLFCSQIFSGMVFLLSTPSDISPCINFTDNLNVNVLKGIQGISAVLTFLIPAYVVALISHPDPSYHLRMKNMIVIRDAVFILMLMISGIPFINLMAEWNTSLNLPESLDKVEKCIIIMEESAQQIQEKLLSADNVIGLLINLIVIALLPALGEEILFRGIIQRILRHWTQNIHVAIIITGFLFSFVHFQFFGFVPRMFLGVLFGYLFYWTGNLWVPILAHFVNNAIATIWYYMYFRHETTVPDPEEFGTSSESAWLYLSIVMFSSITIFYFYRRRKARHVLHK
ncbi:MAG: CPBP family intramembrane glutamic endopeptidase [Bacteroidales bacterium]